MKKTVLLGVYITLILCGPIFTGCERNNTEIATDRHHSEFQIENKDKIIKFLSITLGVPVEDVKIDYRNKDFYITNPMFREKIVRIEKLYKEANEYKLNHEK